MQYLSVHFESAPLHTVLALVAHRACVTHASPLTCTRQRALFVALFTPPDADLPANESARSKRRLTDDIYSMAKRPPPGDNAATAAAAAAATSDSAGPTLADGAQLGQQSTAATAAASASSPVPAALLASGSAGFIHAVLRPPHFTPVVPPRTTLLGDASDLPLSVRAVEKVLARDNNHALLRRFEPLLRQAMGVFMGTALVPLRHAILRLLTTLMKYGVDFARLDQDGAFGEHVLTQIVELQARHENPDVIALFPGKWRRARTRRATLSDNCWLTALLDCVVAPLLVARKSDTRTMERTLHICGAGAQFVVT